MVGFSGMIDRQLMIFVLIAIGFLFAKIGFIEDKARRFLSELIIKVLMPCSLLTALMVETVSDRQLQGFFIALAVGFVMEVFFFLTSKPLSALSLPEERIPLRYALTSPNAAFMGIPIIGGLFGQEGLLYLAALLIPINLFMFFFALRLFLPAKGEGARPSLWAQLLHPSLIAVALGFTMMITGLRPPTFLTESIVALGGCTTPMSMILIGAILATVDLKTIVTRSSLYYCGLRLGVLPLVVFGFMLLAGAPARVTGVTVLIAGMPAAVSTAALATSYNGNAPFASKLIFLSTALSLITLPLLAVLVNFILPG